MEKGQAAIAMAKSGVRQPRHVVTLLHLGHMPPAQPGEGPGSGLS